MRSNSSQIKFRRQGHLVSQVEESKEITGLYRKHKIWLLKAKYHYTSLNYSLLVSNEILRHDRNETIDHELFLKNKTLTRETLSSIIRLNLKNPIEAYMVLKKPLSADDLILDINNLGETFFKNSSVEFCKIQCRLKKYIYRLKEEKVVLNQLAILKSENPGKYTDMLRTGLLNLVIESRFTDSEIMLENSLVAGIFHDIGFLYLEPKYNDRKGRSFTIHDLKKMQHHAELGFHLLKPWFHEDILNAAMNHHIGEDSSGYPRQMSIQPNHLSSLTGFTSAFVACLRKHKLEKALKIQDLYSRALSHSGGELKPFFRRDFYQILESFEIQFNRMGKNIKLDSNRKYSVILHNFLVYIHDLGRELKKLDSVLLDFVKDRAAHRLDLQDDVDDIFDHIKKLNIIIGSCGKSPGLRQIMKDNFLASTILSDIEIISLELHRNNRFLVGLFSYLNAKIKDFTFESTVFKKAMAFSNNIKRNISDQMDKEVNVFDLLNAISG